MDTVLKENEMVQTFAEFEKLLGDNTCLPFHKTRISAIDKFKEVGFPNRRIEDWKYTDISPILRENFRLTELESEINQTVIDKLTIEENQLARLVFVNGHYSKQFSYIYSDLSKVQIKNLKEAFISDKTIIKENLSKYASFDSEPFTALNTAFTDSGTFIFVPANTIVEKPIQILHLSTADQKHYAHPRNLIIVSENSQFEVIETIHHLNGGKYFNNAVTEIACHPNSVVNHVVLQDESPAAYRISNSTVHQQQNSVYTNFNIDLGGSIIRNNSRVILDGEHCESNLYGFYFTSNRQHVDNHTYIDHVKPNCNSNELYKGVLSDKSRAVFSGKIHVFPDAQKTNAFQSNKNLLLSDEAEVDTKPQLKIFADDVKCSHGATIGQLDEAALFYLQQRGISLNNARAMLRYAFAGEVVDKIKSVPLREKISAMIHERLKIEE